MKIYNPAFLLLFQFFIGSSVPDSQQKQKANTAGAANVIFRSTDGGKTWQDISEGLPENLQGNDIQRGGFISNDKGLYLRVGNGMYSSQPNSTAPFWKKNCFPDEHSSIAPGNTGIIAYSWNGQFSQKINGTDVSSPMYTNFQVREVRNVFETAGGIVFIASDNGLFKSTDSGKSWKQVYTGGWIIKLAEANGVLMATSPKGILRSTDGGETWDCVLYEGGVGIDITAIKGGFAAINYNAQLKVRTVQTSYDGGTTWQRIDGGLPANLSIASIIQVDEDFFCGHPAGIFKSSDKGITWKLLLPSIDKEVFNLFVSGNVIYAIPRSGGC